MWRSPNVSVRSTWLPSRGHIGVSRLGQQTLLVPETSVHRCRGFTRLVAPFAARGLALRDRFAGCVCLRGSLGVGSVRTKMHHLPATSYYKDVPEDIKPIPIAIVGRPNVGKSTLFNRLLSGTRKKNLSVPRVAIVNERAGTTRDRKDATAAFGGLVLRVIDTGGLESEEAMRNSTLLASMREQVVKAIAEAEAVLFVFDAKEGVTPLDIQVAKILMKDLEEANLFRDRFQIGEQRESVPVILVANKAEGAMIGSYLNDCYDLGFGDPVVISAKQNEGMEDLYDRLCVEVGHLQVDNQEGDDVATDDEREGEESEEVSDEETDVDPDEPVPTLKWMPPVPLTDQQRASLRWFATHPADPLGELDAGLKKAVLHKGKDKSVPRYWLDAPQRALPDKETRDYVMKFRRLQDQDAPMRVAFIGQPSSGKSSIINALLQEERVVVDEAEGTTMDSVVCNWNFKGEDVKLIDTCGIYRGWAHPGVDKSWIDPGLGTRRAIRKSHMVVLVIDVQRYRKMTYYSCPSRFEIKLARFALDQGKGLIIAVNKWDLINEEEQAKYRDDILKRIQDYISDCKGVPVVFMSAKYNLNLSMLMIRTLSLYKRWSARLPTSKLNSWLQAWMIRWPPPWKRGAKCQVKYMTQTRSRPPTFVVWTNTAWDGMPVNYIKQLQNTMRDEFRISGVPIKFIMRSTLMPKPQKKLSKKDVLKWKRMGPKQADAVTNLNSKKMLRRVRIKQTD